MTPGATGRMRYVRSRARQGLWILSERLARPLPACGNARATVLIAYFHPSRTALIDAQLRSILKCRSVERIVLSVHNPALALDRRIHALGPRVLVRQATRERGCGHRWAVAGEFDADYLIVIDDDILLLPRQVQALFDCLRQEPDRPHGLAGLTRGRDGGFAFHEREDRTVDFLCEVYAVTRHHLQQFTALRARFGQHASLEEMIESSADFVLISRAGAGSPRIHDLGRVFRSPTFKEADVAVHQRTGFWGRVGAVCRILDGERTC